MGAASLGSRAIIGSFYKRLTEVGAAAWVNKIGMLFQSNQESETYKFLGMIPALREWIGGRQAKGFTENGITIINKKFEATLEVLVDEIRRDKTGQVMVRVNELATRAIQHWAQLVTTLVINGEAATSGLCYDGQFFFDTDHSEGSSGTQSNDLSIDISGLPVTAALQGSITKPGAQIMEIVFSMMLEAILGFKDNQGQPLNDGARSFLFMVPVPLMAPSMSALSDKVLGENKSNSLLSMGFNLELIVNPRLTWTSQVACFRTDGDVKPFILQEEEAIKMDAIAEGSETEFKEDKHLYGVTARRNVGFGMWQQACLATMT